MKIAFSIYTDLCDKLKEPARLVMIKLANEEYVDEEEFLVWYDYMICAGWKNKYPDLVEEVISNYLFSKD